MDGQETLADTIQDAVLALPIDDFRSHLPAWEAEAKKGKRAFAWKQEHWDHILSEYQSEPSWSAKQQAAHTDRVLGNMATLLELTSPAFGFPVHSALVTLCEQDVNTSSSEGATISPRLDQYRKCLMLLASRTEDKMVLQRAYLVVKDSTECELVRAVLATMMQPYSESDASTLTDEVRDEIA